METIWPHRILSGAAALAFAAVLTGCGSSTDGDAAEDLDASNVAADASTATTGSGAQESTADDEATSSSTPSESTTTLADQPSSTADASTEVAVDLSEVLSRDGNPQLLEPGRYSAAAFTSDAVIDLGSPLNVVFYGDAALIVRDPELPEDQRGALVFTAPLGVLPPDQAGIHQPHEPVVPEAAIPLPEDLGTWLRSIEQIEITDAGELEAITGFWYEFELGENAQTFDCNSSPSCIGLLALPEGVMTFQQERIHRFYELDAFPGLVAWAGAAPGEAAPVFEHADAVIASLMAP